MAIELGGAPLISALLTHVVPFVSEEIYHYWGVKNEMKQLQKTLEAIQGVLTDAERKQEDKNIKLWLRDLKEIAYDAEDILDEFAYESLRIQTETRKRKQIQNFFSPSNFACRIKMVGKLKDLNKKLVEIEKRKSMFHDLSIVIANLRISDTTESNIGQSSRETFSDVNTSEIIGRELAASEVKKMLFNSCTSEEISSSSIIRIVGMGGLGKTALAQIIYNDEDVSRQFRERMWVCISQHSDQKRVFLQLLESITRKGHNLSNLDTVVNSLKKELHNKRYLIVLDDMWYKKGNQWDQMLKTLLHTMGAQGSKVIITARSNEVMVSVASSLTNYDLVGLSDEESWILLEKIAFGPEGLQPANLVRIAKKIAKKCGGVPLAIKVLGGLMYANRSEEEWLSIESNVIWEQEEGEERIIKVLKLSYDYLEPHLKQCFTYCSLFEKDHIINRKTLLQLWMAEGFLSSDRPNTEMEVGEKYFNILLRNSFFQEVQEDEMGYINSCKMHDLVHDLAQFLTRTEFSIMHVNLQTPEDILHGLRRINLFTDPNELSPFPEWLTSKRKKLRAFLCTPPRFVNDAYAMEQIFKNFSHLRVLDLSYYPIDGLPDAITNFKYLRYLNLSNSRLTKLPNSVTTLYNLQFLILKDCFELIHLPRDLRKLKKLKHLVICKSKDGIDDQWIPPMPSGVRNFLNLQYLPHFTVGIRDHGFGIGELGSLNFLGDELHIHNLENASTREEAAGARIGEKKRIRCLVLHWKVTESYVRGDFEVLEGVQPHRNLKKLGIYNYVGLNFSTWLMNLNNLLPNLVNIVLENCSTCVSLPPLGSLHFLKVLKLAGFPALKCIGSDFFDGNSSTEVCFPHLEDLSICRMHNLVEIEEWNDYISESSSSLSFNSGFPKLKKLCVQNCPKLRIMPTGFFSIEKLFFSGNCCIGYETIMSLVENSITSLISVDISSCDEVVLLPLGLLTGNFIEEVRVQECRKLAGFIGDTDHMEEDVQGFNVEDEEQEEGYLYTLKLSDCPALISFPDISRFNFLADVSFFGCNMMSLPTGIENIPRLRYLGLGDFSEEMDFFPFPAANLIEENIVGHYFPSLVALGLHGWSKLNCLPDQIQYIASLQAINITGFGSLVVLPEWMDNLTSLRDLTLIDCCNLEYMPSEEVMLCLTSLQVLKIDECPLLADKM